jgi:hypothetical protein
VLSAVVHAAVLKASDRYGGQVFGVKTAEAETFVQDAEQS